MKNQKPDIIHINNGGFPGADSCNLLSLISKKYLLKQFIQLIIYHELIT